VGERKPAEKPGHVFRHFYFLKKIFKFQGLNIS
jgi:hypothetical protein